jgi:hypothetical protein
MKTNIQRQDAKTLSKAKGKYLFGFKIKRISSSLCVLALDLGFKDSKWPR